MAGYWPVLVFCVFMDLVCLSVHKHEKMNAADIRPTDTEQA